MVTDCNKKDANLYKTPLPDSSFKDRHANELSGIFLSPDERIQLALCGITWFLGFFCKDFECWPDRSGDRL